MSHFPAQRTQHPPRHVLIAQRNGSQPDLPNCLRQLHCQDAHIVVKLAAPGEAFDFGHHFVEQSLHWPISAFRHRRCKASLPKLNVRLIECLEKAVGEEEQDIAAAELSPET